MKRILALLLMLVPGVALGQDCSDWDKRPEPGQARLPANLVPFPATCRVQNVRAANGEGCCGWASLKDLLLQAGYKAEADGLDIHRGGVSNVGNKSDLSDWLDEQRIEYDSSYTHDMEFMESHLPCLVFFNCANSDYGYCEEDCEGIFDRRHRRPWVRPMPGPGHNVAGHVAVIAGTDADHVYMVANRPANYSDDTYQRIDKADFSSRWFGYCLCLRKHKKPQVKPPEPVKPQPVSPAPTPAPQPVKEERIYSGEIIVHVTPK